MPNTPTLTTVDIGSYLSGYTDGEGSFFISFSPRPTFFTKIEVRPSFGVAQNSDRKEVLLLMQQYFGCGSIRKNPCDKTYKYEVRSIHDLMDKIIPHFKKYPLLSSKKKDFELFAVICKKIQNGEHRKKGTLRRIIHYAYQMNGLGARKYTKTELLTVIDEDIVCASSN